MVKHADSQHRGCQFDSSMCHFLNAICEEGNGKPPREFHFPRRNSERCLWFLLRSTSSVQRSRIQIRRRRNTTWLLLWIALTVLELKERRKFQGSWVPKRSKASLDYNHRGIMYRAVDLLCVDIKYARVKTRCLCFWANTDIMPLRQILPRWWKQRFKPNSKRNLA